MSKEETGNRRSFLKGAACLAMAFALPAELRGLPVSETEGRRLGKDQIYPIPTSDGVQIDYSCQLILVRQQNRVIAFNLSCPHEHAAVKWVAKDSRFQCTRHDSRYQPNGVYTSGRATRNMDRFAIRREGAQVVVDLDRLIRSDQDTAGWVAAEITV
jgi:Rieske Fe-S protein